mmetsp:Transcript_43594/g.144306  ORF Transcript_43594/g.144306 Transcript_43594/m.144306 type:complete len:255 (+) Transcript_43594:201-965(+)
MQPRRDDHADRVAAERDRARRAAAGRRRRRLVWAVDLCGRAGGVGRHPRRLAAAAAAAPTRRLRGAAEGGVRRHAAHAHEEVLPRRGGGGRAPLGHPLLAAAQADVWRPCGGRRRLDGGGVRLRLPQQGRLQLAPVALAHAHRRRQRARPRGARLWLAQDDGQVRLPAARRRRATRRRDGAMADHGGARGRGPPCRCVCFTHRGGHHHHAPRRDHRYGGRAARPARLLLRARLLGRDGAPRLLLPQPQLADGRG